jgi:heme-degrading monooxygenase HmoA
MPEIGEDTDDVERIAANSEAAKNAWRATLEDMEGMASELEEQGWTTTVLAADDTTPNPPGTGDSELYGFVYTVPGNSADEFVEAFEQGHEEGSGFEEYEVYRSETGGRAFQVTVFYDEPTARAILLAGNYALVHAEELMRAALERSEVYTHVQTLDGTIIGSFQHEGWEHFFPNAKQRLGEIE